MATTSENVPVAKAETGAKRQSFPMCMRMKQNPDLVLDTTQLRAAVMEAPIIRLIAASTPRHMRADASRLAQAMIVEMGKQEKLMAATAVSLLGCLVQCSTLGLQFGGPLGQAYLVPYWNGKKRRQEAQLQIGYKGFVYLGHNSPVVSAFDAHPVFEQEMESFSIRFGTDEGVTHAPLLRGVREEKDLVGCYAYWVNKDGRKQVEWMTVEELYAHRDRHAASKGFENKQATPWWQHFVEMSRKTVMRRIGKRIPLQAIQTAASLDEMADEDVPQQAGAIITLDADDMPSLTAINAAEAVGADLGDGEYIENGQVFDKNGFVRDVE